jgi:DNA-directed RNA polymerase subunit RPC12/RpoP
LLLSFFRSATSASGETSLAVWGVNLMRGLLTIITGVVFIVGGLTGVLVLMGTESGLALAAVGVVILLVGIGQRVSAPRVTPQEPATVKTDELGSSSLPSSPSSTESGQMPVAGLAGSQPAPSADTGFLVVFADPKTDPNIIEFVTHGFFQGVKAWRAKLDGDFAIAISGGMVIGAQLGFTQPDDRIVVRRSQFVIVQEGKASWLKFGTAVTKAGMTVKARFQIGDMVLKGILSPTALSRYEEWKKPSVINPNAVKRLPEKQRTAEPPSREDTIPLSAPRPATATSPLRFDCPKCGKRLKVKEEFLGKQVKCPSCNHRVQVPARAEDRRPIGDDK